MRFPENLRYGIIVDTVPAARRKIVVRTLNDLDAERKIVNTNEQWKSLSTQRKRLRLLDEIHGWYDREVKENRHGARLAEPAVNSLREKAPKQNSHDLRGSP